MNVLKATFKIVAVVLYSLAFQTLVYGQQSQVYVASRGTDTGTCELTAPCREISYALTQVVPNGFSGGTVVVLNSASYQPFTIKQSVSVIATPGAYAEIPVSGAAIGVTVSASSSARVVLRGLAIKGDGNLAEAGIKVDFVGALQVENCVISGFQRGIDSLVVNGELQISDTTVRDCILVGIRVNSESAGSLTVASIDHCRIVENTGPSNFYGVGIQARKNVKVIVRDSVVSHNRSYGFDVGFARGANATMVIDNCSVSHNRRDAVLGSDGSIIYVSNSTLTFNAGYGFGVAGNGVIYTRGNNTVEENALGAGSATLFTAK